MNRIGSRIAPSARMREIIEAQRIADAEWARYQVEQPETARAWLEALEADHARTVRLAHRAALAARADARLAAMSLPAHVVEAAKSPQPGFEPLAVAREFFEQRGPQFLALLGSGGVGKTVAGVWLLREVMRDGGRAEVIRGRDLAAFSDFDEDDRWRLERICTADAVLVDDLEDADIGTPRGRAVFRDWFERRMQRPHFRTVITSNLSRKALATCVGPRIVDRLAECGMSEEWQGEQSRRERRFPRPVTP